MDFTLEDSTTEKVPPLLANIVTKILAHNKSCDSAQRNLMFILLLFIMIENSFLLLDEINEIIDPQKLNLEQLMKWQSSPGTIELNIIMCGFDDFLSKLIVSSVGTTVLVNLVIKELNYETYTACIPISRYVVSPEASTIPMIFRDLKQLSMTLKNKIITAVKSRILSHHGYASASLIGLPEEVFFIITMNLPITDIVKLCKTCKRINKLLNNETLWHSLFKRDFGHHVDVVSWKMLYKEKYIEQEDHRLRVAHTQAGTMHDYMDYSDLVSYIDNPMWGMIL